MSIYKLSILSLYKFVLHVHTYIYDYINLFIHLKYIYTSMNGITLTINLFKGTGHFFETLSVGSVPGTDHSFLDLRFFKLKPFVRPKNAFICLCQRSLFLPA